MCSEQVHSNLVHSMEKSLWESRKSTLAGFISYDMMIAISAVKYPYKKRLALSLFFNCQRFFDICTCDHSSMLDYFYKCPFLKSFFLECDEMTRLYIISSVNQKIFRDPYTLILLRTFFTFLIRLGTLLRTRRKFLKTETM